MKWPNWTHPPVPAGQAWLSSARGDCPCEPAHERDDDISATQYNARRMSCETKSSSYRLVVVAAFSFCAALLLCYPLGAEAGEKPQKVIAGRSSKGTLMVDCAEHGNAKRVLSPVAVSQGGRWRAYVEVNIQSRFDCLHTSRLWVAKANNSYRLVYLIPPSRWKQANGMKILGWAPTSTLRRARCTSLSWKHCLRTAKISDARSASLTRDLALTETS
jgi:hypothetical protein